MSAIATDPNLTPIYRAKRLETAHLHVISVVSNPVRYASRYRLYRDFQARMRAAGVTHHTVELLFGARPCEVTEAQDSIDI